MGIISTIIATQNIDIKVQVQKRQYYIHCSSKSVLIKNYRDFSLTIYYYPAPYRGTGHCFPSISLFVSLSARLRENGWTDLHEIFREGMQ